MAHLLKFWMLPEEQEKLLNLLNNYPEPVIFSPVNNNGYDSPDELQTFPISQFKDYSRMGKYPRVVIFLAKHQNPFLKIIRRDVADDRGFKPYQLDLVRSLIIELSEGHFVDEQKKVLGTGYLSSGSVSEFRRVNISENALMEFEKFRKKFFNNFNRILPQHIIYKNKISNQAFQNYKEKRIKLSDYGTNVNPTGEYKEVVEWDR